MRMIFCVVALFFTATNALASSETVQDTTSVLTTVQTIKKYNCTTSHAQPECGALDVLLCRDTFDFNACDRVGIPASTYKSYLSQTNLRGKPLERMFYVFRRHKILTDRKNNLPNWMKPKTAFLWASIVWPSNGQNEDWDKLIQNGPKDMDLQEFSYGMTFVWSNNTWKLSTYGNPVVHGCHIDSMHYEIKDPICYGFSPSAEKKKDIQQMFFN